MTKNYTPPDERFRNWLQWTVNSFKEREEDETVLPETALCNRYRRRTAEIILENYNAITSAHGAQK